MRFEVRVPVPTAEFDQLPDRIDPTIADWTTASWYETFGGYVEFAHGPVPARVFEDGAVVLLLFALALVYGRLSIGSRMRRPLLALVAVFLLLGCALVPGVAALGGAYPHNGGITFYHGNGPGVGDRRFGPPWIPPGMSGTMELVWLPCRDCDRFHPIATQDAEVWINYYLHRDHADPGFPYCCYRIRNR